MRAKVAKAINKRIKRQSKVAWIEYMKAVKQWPFSARWRFAWHILFGKKMIG